MLVLCARISLSCSDMRHTALCPIRHLYAGTLPPRRVWAVVDGVLGGGGLSTVVVEFPLQTSSRRPLFICRGFFVGAQSSPTRLFSTCVGCVAGSPHWRRTS